MYLWILSNLAKIKKIAVIAGIALSVIIPIWQEFRINILKKELKELEISNKTLISELEQKGFELDVLNENCQKKELVNKEINEVKTQILNKAQTDQTTVTNNKNIDDSLIKAGEFILSKAKE